MWGLNTKQISQRLRQSIFNAFSDGKVRNPFNEAFLLNAGGGYTEYDQSAPTYIEKGYNINPLVYAPINQMASKTASVPFYIKKVEDKQAKLKLDALMNSTKGNLSTQQYVKKAVLENKAFTKEDLPFPMERPNIYQTWSEWLALYKTFLKTTGNVYIYMLSPEEGMRAGEPLQVYLLPSQFMQLIVGKDVDMFSVESPIVAYILTQGRSYIDFDAKDVIHIKYSNPNYNENGSHLYGMSPLMAALRNMQSSNTGLDQNIKALKSGGAYGLIHGKGQSFTPDQAKEIKERLKEMDASPENLSKLAGVSAEVGFTRLSLTSDELKPFDYLKFDKQQIADCLNWSIDDENRGDFGGTINEIRKQRITDNIKPDLDLLSEALNSRFLPRFKGYENTVVVFDVMELPEMQADIKDLVEWLKDVLDRGVVNRDEVRIALNYIPLETDEMKRFTVSNDIISLKEALDNDFSVNG